jgi:TolB protein
MVFIRFAAESNCSHAIKKKSSSYTMARGRRESTPDDDEEQVRSGESRLRINDKVDEAMWRFDAAKDWVVKNWKLVAVIAVIVVVFFILLILAIIVISAIRKRKPKVYESTTLSNVKAITQGGVNAEAYWNREGTKLVFQGIREGHAKCDQIFVMNADGTDVKQVSNGKGRTTCGYFLNDDKHVVYGSTMDTMGPGCPPDVDRSFGYVWPVYKTMDIYKADYRTGEVVQQLTANQGYNAEATVSPDGQTILFTSTRDGDLELYTMAVNGTNVKRLTYTPGYDGGAFFSNDGKKIVWRANRPRGEDLTNYLNLLSLGLVEPVATDMDIYVMNADGTSQRKLTTIGGANFAPYFLPDDSGIIFASNTGGTGETFHLYTIKLDGTGLQQITTDGTFNLFPMFSPDGKYLAWESNRASKSPHEMNVFIAEWKTSKQ